MSEDVLKKEFVTRYIAVGEQKFYNFLLFYALNKLVLISQNKYNGVLPSIEFLEYHDRFIILYRRDGDDMYLKIAKLFRKAGHKIYRIMLKKNMIIKNEKFLNLV
jgi:hypothetical protein